MGIKAKAMHALASEVRADQEEGRRQEEEQTRQRIKDNARQGLAKLLKECRQEIRKAASSGATSAHVRVVESFTDHPKAEDYLTGAEKARLAAEALGKDGFSVKINQDRYVGIGSDPYPNHYFVSMEISF